MSGGGMGFIVAPEKKQQAQAGLQEIMSRTKRELEGALPFAMEPVVYDFAINERGTWADLLTGDEALLPQNYYALIVPQLLRSDLRSLPAAAPRGTGQVRRRLPQPSRRLRGVVQTVFDRLLPRSRHEAAAGQTLAELLEQNAFDRAQHEQVRADLKNGRIGLAQNRLPASTKIEDVQAAGCDRCHQAFARRIARKRARRRLRTAKSPW